MARPIPFPSRPAPGHAMEGSRACILWKIGDRRADFPPDAGCTRALQKITPRPTGFPRTACSGPSRATVLPGPAPAIHARAHSASLPCRRRPPVRPPGGPLGPTDPRWLAPPDPPTRLPPPHRDKPAIGDSVAKPAGRLGSMTATERVGRGARDPRRARCDKPPRGPVVWRISGVRRARGDRSHRPIAICHTMHGSRSFR